MDPKADASVQRRDLQMTRCCIKDGRDRHLMLTDNGLLMYISNVSSDRLIVPFNSVLKCYTHAKVLPSEALLITLQSAISLLTPSTYSTSLIHSLLPDNKSVTNKQDIPLHLSLSRPLILQTNQRESLRSSVSRIARESST